MYLDVVGTWTDVRYKSRDLFTASPNPCNYPEIKLQFQRQILFYKIPFQNVFTHVHITCIILK